MVINVISEYPPNTGGGGGILAEELVKRLLTRGHAVNVITWGKSSVQKSKLHLNLSIYKVCQSGEISPIQKLKFGYFAGRKIKDLDGIVHGHIFFFPLDRKRTIYTFHLTQLGELRALQKIKDKSIVIIISMMLKKLYLIWEKYIIKNSLKLIAVSNTVKNELLELGAKPEQIEVIHNTINLENYHRASPKIVKQLRTKFVTDPNIKLIFAIGRLLPRKGFQYLIRAVTLLKDKNIKLLIAGEGGYRQTLEQLSKKLKIVNRITFLGKVPKDKVKNFYSSTDVTVVPSLYEPFGLVILEAMACGSPLVCTNVCDFPLIAGKAALYALPQNPEDLAEKIRYVLAHPEKAKEKAEYGLKKVKNYTWEPYIERLEKIYAEIDKG
ncbi:MAG: glycosyltransferase family 4 protein [Candidatus Marinimicrobia bacterium]|nr:glycosyltransferase family 4 protein [Candidatus Neomarinimicrobiota bacterium]